MTQTTDWFEDQEIGCKGTSPTRTVTEHDILTFAGLNGDMSELHTSETHAARSEFGSRIAHGMLNLALAQGLVVRSGRLVTSGVALLGWREIRFLAPVRIGDTIRAEWQTIELRDSATHPTSGIVRDLITLRNQHDTVVMTGEVAELVRKRPA